MNPSPTSCRNQEWAKTVYTIIRERDGDGSKLCYLISPSFNFADPLFFRELLSLQNNNVMFSIWFFRWLCSTFDYKPDSVSLSLLFGSLLDARAAKGFLDSTGFNPEVTLLERYVKCLCKDGLVDEGIKVCTLLKEKKLDRFWSFITRE